MFDCTRCERWFNTWRAYDKHIAGSPCHNLCDDCNIDFETWMQLQNHWIQSSQHYYCRYCDDHFIGGNVLEEHYIDSHAYCRSCQRPFKNEYGLRQHYRQSNQHHYCATCSKLCTSENNLDEHLNSSAHRPKDVPCPCCSAMFISLPALALHFDSGFCISGIGRNWVNRFVRKSDTDNMITVPTKTNSIIKYVPSTASRSWDRCGFECNLCHKTHINFNALKQHLASPAHQFQMYICRGLGCGQRFTVFSALMQHVGKKKCGHEVLKHVNNTMDDMIKEMCD